MIKEVRYGGKSLGYVVVHCHGTDKGKRISATPKPVSYAKALSIHNAIEASKHRKK
jgi:hypothetical protein